MIRPGQFTLSSLFACTVILAVVFAFTKVIGAALIISLGVLLAIGYSDWLAAGKGSPASKDSLLGDPGKDL